MKEEKRVVLGGAPAWTTRFADARAGLQLHSDSGCSQQQLNSCPSGAGHLAVLSSYGALPSAPLGKLNGSDRAAAAPKCARKMPVRLRNRPETDPARIHNAGCPLMPPLLIAEKSNRT